jgi:phenylacetate-CoA ligase
MTELANRAYGHLPRAVQVAAINVAAIALNRDRYGGGFSAVLDEYTARSGWTADEMFAFRDGRLCQAVQRAAATKHWRQVFADLGVSAVEAARPDVFATLPTVTKAELQTSLDSFLVGGPTEPRTRWAHTSGTTGAGLRFPVTRQSQQEQWAVWWRYRSWHGIGMDEWCGYFGGRAVVPISRARPPYWVVNRPARQVLFSNYHFTERGLGAIVAELRRRRLTWLHGYPSSLVLVAQHLLEHGGDLGYQLRWVTTGAENLLQHQRDVLAAAFGVEAVENYGNAEGVANASQCPLGRLHIDEDFGHVEVDPMTGSLIGSGFANEAIALLRYETGDVGRLLEAGCPCGLPGRVLESVDGREEDYVVLSDGRQIGRVDHVFKDLLMVKEAQVTQSIPGQARVAVVPTAAYRDGDADVIRAAFRSYFGGRLTVEIELVPQIARTANGKLRLVISSVSSPHRSSDQQP